jgi:hypothetical protein
MVVTGVPDLRRVTFYVATDYAFELPASIMIGRLFSLAHDRSFWRCDKDGIELPVPLDFVTILIWVDGNLWLSLLDTDPVR